jgi:hypothetical protein
MARPNYSFEKRQRELAKKKKKEEKKQQRALAKEEAAGADPDLAGETPAADNQAADEKPAS